MTEAATTLMAAALAARERGDLSEAVACYRKLIQIDPSDWHLHIGTCLFEAGEHTQAIYHLHQAEIRRGPSDGTSIKLALSYKRACRFGELKDFVLRRLAEMEFSRTLLDVAMTSDHVLFDSSEIASLRSIIPADQLTESDERGFARREQRPIASSNRSAELGVKSDKNPIVRFHELVVRGCIPLCEHEILRWSPSTVPTSNLFTYWDTDPAPDEIARNVDTWRRYSAKAKPVISDEEARAYIASSHGDELLAAYDASRHPAMKSDILRLAVLHAEGGLYIDADFNAGRHFDKFLTFLAEAQPEYLFGMMLFDHRHFLQNGFIFARDPGSTVIGRAIDQVIAVHKAGEFSSPKSINALTGPGMLTGVFLDALCDDLALIRRATIISRSAVDLFLPQGRASYKADPSKNWRGN